jgi:biopolymer transport protein ExbD
MRRRAKPTVKEDVTCNLIPMVDIMFLLLLFFILGADMSQREQADVVLPQADMVQEDKEKDTSEPTTTVNIQHRQESASFNCPLNKMGQVCRDGEHWQIVIRGKEYTWESAEQQLKEEADLDREYDEEAKADLSNRKVIIRADRTASYGDVQRLIQLCSAAKIFKIEVAAAKPPAS